MVTHLNYDYYRVAAPSPSHLQIARRPCPVSVRVRPHGHRIHRPLLDRHTPAVVGGEVQRDGRPLMHAAPVGRERTQLRAGGGGPHPRDRPFPLLPGDHEPTEGVDGEADDLVVVTVEEALRVMFFVCRASRMLKSV